MINYIQYHNSELMGISPKDFDYSNGFGIRTKKTLKNVLNQRIWLIAGEGNPRKYYLVYWFIAEEINEENGDNFIKGKNGFVFKEPILLNNYEWFPSFLEKLQNFSLGFRQLDNEYVRLLEDLTKSEKEDNILETCVYTIKHSEDLNELLSSTRQGTFREYRNWSGAKKLFEIAQSTGKQFIILFAPAESTLLIHSWAIITDITISDDRTYTDYSFSELQNFETEFYKTDLILQNTNQNIDPDFIRPYAICKTPYENINNKVTDDDPLSEFMDNHDVNNIEDILLDINEKMRSLKPDKVEKIINKSIRKDSKIVQLLKQHHNFQCQYPDCNAKVLMKNGKYYVEVAHIRPVSKGGKSIIGNLLVLCPNHHKEFDFGNLTIINQEELYVEGNLNGNFFKINCF